MVQKNINMQQSSQRLSRYAGQYTLSLADAGSGGRGVIMVAFADWFPLLVVGSGFTTVGLLKVYGLRHNIVGGGGKPLSCRLRGSCPTWSKHLNMTMTVLFLVIGLSFLSILGWIFLTAVRR